MHLKAIKLRGFKSFVDPIEVRLEPGVAVVIGPNGSGKSNISDSILWATGSMSPHELRAEKPDDVLFAGSTTRKPVESCEVELLFDNEDGAWPELPFSEVSVTRRLHRGGEGQYLVNRAVVRRIDLIELLSDVGLGGGLRSVISQGSVESVLGAKPSERRELVEEAAGLGRFKHRRHRAELKLARVATQVERARDVEAEVKKRLRPLALQATAAERAAKLGEELARLYAAIATLELARLGERRAASVANRERETAQRRELETRIAALIEARERAEEELTDAAGTREGATAALYRLRSAVERIELRRESAQALHDALAAQHRAAVEFDPTRSDELVRAARAANAAAQEAAAERARLEFEAEERWAHIAAIERSQLATVEADLATLVQERRVAESDLVPGGGPLLGLRELSQRLRVRQESVQRLRDDLSAELEEARREVPAGPSPAELGRIADETDELARAAVRERDDLQARAALARERLAALEQSLAEREGLPPAARALAEQGERLALSTLHVEPGDERAVAAALGRLASAVVADDPERGLELLERARELGLGSLVVLVGRDPGEVVSALPVVERDALLASPVPAVTREGLGWDPQRGELWFAGETAEAVLLELEAHRQRVAEETASLATAAEAAAQVAADAVAKAQAAAAAFAPVAHLRGKRRRDPVLLARLTAHAGTLDSALSSAIARAAQLEEPLAARAASAAETLAALGMREAELRAAASEAGSRALAAERRANGRTGRAGAAEDMDALRSAAEALAAHAAEAAAAAKNAADHATAASRALAEAEGRASPRVGALVLERLADYARRLVAALEVDASGYEAPLRERVEADAARTAALGNELRRLGGEEVEVRNAAAAVAEHVAALDVELARIDAEADDAKRRLAAADAEPAEGDDPDELATRAERLERRRLQLGQVNPLAREEYEAEKERLDELSTQREDLERSLEELEQLRRDLTETVERRFAETFEAVEKHFAEVAASLFPGGEGRLRLTEPDEEGEEPGIEVELRPVGKRVTRLSLLSGGEKALGAIAFLFSLFLARPSPFYLLDEVEAALDDANIGRFTGLLRQYADRAQFIVVTHQKRTMEAADVLYGVTMSGDGVSQLVSRRLPHDEEVAATA